MGMTLWIHTLEGRKMSKESDDHSFMYKFAGDLDKACKKLGVPLLSSFFDSTDLELNMAEAEEGEETEPDPETGWAYGIDDMKWFDAAVGLSALTAIRSHVASNSSLKLDLKTNQRLLEEFDDCISKLGGPAKQGGKFHLAVVM